MAQDDWGVGAEAALRRAARAARKLALETGTPLWVMRNGRIVDALAATRKKKRGGKQGKQ